MSFIRPEIVASANRWRESLAGAAAVLFGAVLVLTGTGAAAIIGTILVVGGGALVFAGLQRARFRRNAAGAGIVRLDEGRLIYFGPIEGGVVAVADLSAIDLITLGGASSWRLSSPGAPPLLIPVGAEGGEVLFDILGGLDGLDTGRMLRAVEAPEEGVTMIWARNPPRLGLH